MAERIDADLDTLQRVTGLLAELQADTAGIAAAARDIMGKTTSACGADDFGREFTEGPEGFRGQGDSTLEQIDNVVTSFGRFTEGVGGNRGSTQALGSGEQASAAEFSKTI